jgi:hypothetical protein
LSTRRVNSLQVPITTAVSLINTRSQIFSSIDQGLLSSPLHLDTDKGNQGTTSQNHTHFIIPELQWTVKCSMCSSPIHAHSCMTNTSLDTLFKRALISCSTGRRACANIPVTLNLLNREGSRIPSRSKIYLAVLNGLQTFRTIIGENYATQKSWLLPEISSSLD